MSGLRVLIVDGDGRMIDKLCRFLQSRGFHADPGHSADEAIAQIARQRYDVVLVDTGLPERGALQVADAIRDTPRRPLLVLLVSPRTGQQTLAAFETAQRLEKPFSGKQLLTVLRGIAPTTTLSTEDRMLAKPTVVDSMGASKSFPSDSGTPPSPSSPSKPTIQGRGQVRSPFDLSLDKLKAAASNNALSAVGVRPPPGAVRPGKLMTIMHKVGTLEQTPFPALLYKLFANQSTGVLTVHRSGSERVIFFKEGEPVYAVSNSASDSLGAILVNLGILKLSQLNTALESRPEGQPLGQALLQMGLLTSQQLLAGLERQVYDRVLSCFSFTTGQYIFTEDTDWLGEVKVFKQNPIQLVVDGVQRFVGPNVLATHLQPHLGQYVVRTEKFEHFSPHFPVDDQGKAALDAIDGSKTLQELTVQGGRDLMGLLRLVWALRLADMVDFLDEPRTYAERSPDKPPLPSRLPTDHNLSVKKVQEAVELARTQREEEVEDPEAEARSALEQRVLDYYVRLGYEDHWQLLGLDRDVSVEAATTAFRKTLDMLPPEQFRMLSDDVREKALEVHEALKKAFNTISEPGSRSYYLRRLKERERAEAAQKTRQQARARRPSEFSGGAAGEPSGLIDFDAFESKPVKPSFPQRERLTTQDTEVEATQNLALVELRRAREAGAENRWKEAWRLIKRASQLNPESQDIIVFQTWIIYNLPHDNRTRQTRVCKNRLELELSLDSALPDAHYYLGRMFEDEADLLGAQGHFQAALLLEPKHPEALSAMENLRQQNVGRTPTSENDENLMNRLKGWFNR